MAKKKRLYDALLMEHLAEDRPMAFVSGPHQVGKTTTCRAHGPSHAKSPPSQIAVAGSRSPTFAKLTIDEGRALVFEVHSPPARRRLRRNAVRRNGSDALGPGRQSGYTIGMKTAISIPDGVFEQAERTAQRLGKSRSQLYSDAVREYVARHDQDEVTEAINRVCDVVDTSADEFLTEAARRTLDRGEW